jgi:site-specific DNA-adenine methylase
MWLIKKLTSKKDDKDTDKKRSKKKEIKNEMVDYILRQKRLQEEAAKTTAEPERSLRFLALADFCATGPVGYDGMLK